MIEKVKEAVKLFDNPTIACSSLSFKADIDDLRKRSCCGDCEKMTDQQGRGVQWLNQI